MDHRTTPSKFAAITPSDTASIGPTIGLYVGGAGNVIATGVDGVAVTFICTAGTTLRGNFTQVKFTGTTASGIVALVG